MQNLFISETPRLFIHPDELVNALNSVSDEGPDVHYVVSENGYKRRDGERVKKGCF